LTPAAPRRSEPPGPLPASAPFPKILLIRFRRIGDIILTTPALALLKRRRPNARVTYLVEEPYRRLVEGNPDLDRVLAVPPRQTRRAFVRFLREVRRERYDVLLDMHGGPRAAWTTLAGGARLKVGHGIKHKSFLYDLTVPRKGTEGPIHSVETHAGLVLALGIEFGKDDIPPLSLPPARPEETARVEDIVAAAAAAKLVVVHIGAGNDFRDWGAERLAALTIKLGDVAGVRVALIGGAGDRGREAEIVRRLSETRSIPLAGRLNLIEIRELIARAALFVGPDSGPMHIAASTATPIVAYFGPTLPAHFGPWRPGVDPAKTVILQKDLTCRPCRQRECVTADFSCLRAITPDEVFAACRLFLL